MTCEACDLNEETELHQPTGQRLCVTCIAAWEHDAMSDWGFLSRHQACTPLRQAVKDYERSPDVVSVRQESDGTWWARYRSGSEIQIHGHCDHPEDERCSTELPPEDEWAALQRIAEQLSV